MQHYQRIKDLREDSDLTQQELCNKLYMNKSTYTYYEQGKHTVPLDFAVTLADFYQVSLDYIAGRTNDKHSYDSFQLNKEEINIIKRYRILTERNKGKTEQFIENLADQQEEEYYVQKEVKSS